MHGVHSKLLNRRNSAAVPIIIDNHYITDIHYYRYSLLKVFIITDNHYYRYSLYITEDIHYNRFHYIRGFYCDGCNQPVTLCECYTCYT